MIVVEGSDNVGKTTLINQLLALDPSLFLMKRERFNPRMGGSIGQSYLQMLLPPPNDRARLTHGVADRLLASECIYGELFRDGCRMTSNEHFLIKAALMSYGAIIVHCDAPDATILDSWREREQLYDRDPIAIARAYRHRLRSIFRPLEVFYYDYTLPNADQRRASIVRYHQRLVERFRVSIEAQTSTCRRDR